MSSKRPGLARRAWLRGAGALALLGPLRAVALAVLPGPQLQVEGIPAFEKHAIGGAGNEPAGVRFLGWHPLRAEMLLLSRNGASNQLHRLGGPGATPQPLTSGRDAVADGRWEPQAGAYLVFSRDQGGDEAYRLYRLMAPDASGGEGGEGGAPVPLTPADERVSEFEFLPAGQGLVYLQEQLDRQAGEAEGGARQSHSRLLWVDPLRPEQRRLLGETFGGRFTGLRVSAGGRIVATLTRGGKSQSLLFAQDGSGARPLDAARGNDEPELDDEERPAAGREDALWRRQALQGDFRHLVRVDARSGRHSSLLVGERGDLEALAEPPPDSARPLALVHNIEGISRLSLFDPAQPDAAPRPIAPELPAGVLRNPQWHPRLPLLGFDHVSADSPGRLYVWNLDGAGLQAWNAAAAEGSGLRTALLRWKSFDGLEISGLHIAPPARFTGPRPVYISIHGGPSSQARPGYVAGVTRLLVERLGMHVIEPNVRGSEGFGKKFLALDNGRLRENAVRDISALLDLVGTRPDMDAARVVVAGGSYGGYMSLAVATHESARIAGSICRVGIANFVSFLENTETYRRDNRRGEYGDERDPAMRAFLQRISPLSHADAVKKPLFIVHGRNDPRVPYGEARAMAAAVRAQGTPVWFLSAADEGHSFTKADNRSYLNQATLEFVQRLVEGRPMR